MTLQQIKTELAGLKTMVADFISGKTAASPEELSGLRGKVETIETSVNTELAQAQADLATARQTIGSVEKQNLELTAKLQTAQEQVNAIGANLSGINTALDEAIATFKLEVKADAPGRDKIAALQGTVTNVLARHGIDAAALPSSQPSGTTRPGPAKILVEFNAITDPALRTSFYRKNKDAIDAAYR